MSLIRKTTLMIVKVAGCEKIININSYFDGDKRVEVKSFVGVSHFWNPGKGERWGRERYPPFVAMKLSMRFPSSKKLARYCCDCHYHFHCSRGMLRISVVDLLNLSGLRTRSQRSM